MDEPHAKKLARVVLTGGRKAPYRNSLIHSVARNPSLAKQLFGYAILGFALTEAIALFALMMAFLILFVF